MAVAARKATHKETVVIISDEQANIGTRENEYIKTMKRHKCEVIVVNPTDYDVHSLLHEVLYVPALTPEGFASAIRYTQLHNATQEELDSLGEGGNNEKIKTQKVDESYE